MGVIPRTQSDPSATYWLDATRLDEASLDRLPPTVFQWALPVRASVAQLEPVPPEPPVVPQVSDVLEIDASAGFEVPAKVRLEEAFSGDEALQMRTALSSLSKDDATRQLEEFWRQSNSWIEPTDVGWRFDKDRNSVILTLSGDGKPEWQGDARSGRVSASPAPVSRLPTNSIGPEMKIRRRLGPPTSPNFRRWTTIIRLPPDAGKLHWDYAALPVHERLGGVSYWREIDFQGRVIRTTMSRRTYLPEITSAQATELNNGLASFDNAVSTVFQQNGLPSLHIGHDEFEKAVARLSAGSVCDASLANGEDVQRIASSAQACVQKALVLAKAGRAEEALADLDAAVALEPESPNSFQRARASSGPARALSGGARGPG